MKIKEGFVLRHVGGMDIAVPTGGEKDGFCGMVTLKGSGAVLFEALMKGSDREGLLKILKEKYDDVEDSAALKDIDSFLKELEKAGILDE